MALIPEGVVQTVESCIRSYCHGNRNLRTLRGVVVQTVARAIFILAVTSHLNMLDAGQRSVSDSPAISDGGSAAAPANPQSLASDAKRALQETMERNSSAGSHGRYGRSVRPQTQTWSDGYRRRMDAVLTNDPLDTDGTLAYWWHCQSANYIYRNRHLARQLTIPISQQPAVQSFIAEHTLPEYTVPEVDFYEIQPKTVTLGPVVQASAQETAPDDRESGDTGTDESKDAASEQENSSARRPLTARLSRDMTSIQPTLSYALRGINEEQLPDDFFEKTRSEEYGAVQSPPTVMQWAPTNLYHYPLYFEDPALERYGHTYHPLVQPFASSGRFAVQLVGLPYQMALHPIHAKEYTLGWYRPGDCAPKKFYQIPFNEEAAITEAVVIAGMILIFP